MRFKYYPKNYTIKEKDIENSMSFSVAKIIFVMY